MLRTSKIRQSEIRWTERCNSKIASRWIGCNMCNMSVLKLNWKKNMKKEWSSWTIELRRDKHNKVHTKMLTSSWCRTTSVTSTMLKAWLGTNLARSLRPTTSHLRMVSLCLPSRRRILWDRLFLRVKIGETLLIRTRRITRPTASSPTRKTEAREESSTISSTWIQLKERLKWCVSNTNRPLWWD